MTEGDLHFMSVCDLHLSMVRHRMGFIVVIPHVVLYQIKLKFGTSRLNNIQTSLER